MIPPFRRPTLGATVLLAGLLAALPSAPATAQEGTAYVAYGDSITSGTGDSVPEGQGAGYPTRLEALLGASNTVVNRGQPNGTTVDLVNRFDDEALPFGGEVLLLMGGTNDTTKEFAPEDSVANLNLIARRANTFGISTVHATIIPRWPEARVDTENDRTATLSGLIRNLAGLNGRRLVDIFETYWVEPERFSLYYADRVGDPVGHPNATGYDVIARAFADVLEDIDSVSPVPGFMSPEPGEKRVGRNENIQVDLWDFGQGIDEASIEMRVDGQIVTPDVTRTGRRVSLNYNPPAPLLGMVRVAVRASDNGGSPRTLDRELMRFFTVQTNFPTGDVNRDGRVDGKDLAVLARGFGQDANAGQIVDPDADLNEDGVIDGMDLAILIDNFGVSL